MEEVFGSLELNVVWLDGCPVGMVHLDYSVRSDESAAKVVFVGLDPAVQGRGLGRVRDTWAGDSHPERSVYQSI
jgi:hypothetical protein